MAEKDIGEESMVSRVTGMRLVFLFRRDACSAIHHDGRLEHQAYHGPNRAQEGGAQRLKRRPIHWLLGLWSRLVDEIRLCEKVEWAVGRLGRGPRLIFGRQPRDLFPLGPAARFNTMKFKKNFLFSFRSKF